ncbi:MAG: acetoacetate decarboxylase family protein [Candidatus Riflebacteria bacterium]|nr:acetoacetate decarboxylase family protein [Candidatus Riflebacteria bacterium]
MDWNLAPEAAKAFATGGKRFFSGIEVTERRLNNDLLVKVPVFFRRWSSIFACFTVDSASVKQLLPSPLLVPVPAISGRTLVGMAAMDYQEVEGLPRYQEFGVMFPVRLRPRINLPLLPVLFPGKFSDFGWFVQYLPVTTLQAEAFGREVWGYPKCQATITFRKLDGWVICSVSEQEQEVLSLRVKILPPRVDANPYPTYTWHEGRILRTMVRTEGEAGVSLCSPDSKFRLGNHPRSALLKSLNPSRRPFLTVSAPLVRSVLFDGHHAD